MAEARWVPEATDERRALVLRELQNVTAAPTCWLGRRTGLGSQAVGAAIRGLVARGHVARASRHRGRAWWSAT